MPFYEQAEWPFGPSLRSGKIFTEKLAGYYICFVEVYILRRKIYHQRFLCKKKIGEKASSTSCIIEIILYIKDLWNQKKIRRETLGGVLEIF